MQPQNSTNVRPSIDPWFKRGLQALGRVSPPAAGALVARIFLRTPPRRRSNQREVDVLLQADRFDAVFEGETLQAYLWGHGPAVLLLHGWGGSAGQLYSFIEPLTHAGFSVVAFDAPAHGASTGDWLAIPRYAAAIRRVAEQVGPLHAIIAHSMGGPAAALALSQGLYAGRFIQIGPPADALAWFMNFSRELGLSADVTAIARRAIEQRAGMSMERVNAAVVGPSLTLPLLVIHDRQDREVPWTDGAAVANAAPLATISFTEGLGHRRILRDPEVIRRSLAFIGRPGTAKLWQPVPRAVA
jgi:pimeloyl-ACP methyl ester carboxylesterase